MKIIVKHHMEPITPFNIRKAVEIRASCYLGDYRGVVPESHLLAYDFEKDLSEISIWLFDNETTDDRHGFIYYIASEPVGMVIGSLADLSGYERWLELNYLFVSRKARGQKIGTKLMAAMAARYSEKGMEGVLLYNWKELSSNAFYRKLEPERIDTTVQKVGGSDLETDIFYWPIEALARFVPLSKIAYFTGTGGVKHVANVLASQLLSQGQMSLQVPMNECLYGNNKGLMQCASLPTDRLFVLFPVYAFDAPDVVYDWLKHLPEGQQTEAVVLSISGGGEVWPNTSCRRWVIKALEAKGYQVIYERMLVMPPNILTEAQRDLIIYLLRTLPQKIRDITKELEEGVMRRDRVKLSSIWIRGISNWEKAYMSRGSRLFKVTENCIKCGKCAKECPVGNIHQEPEHYPVFDDRCQMCLGCYYGCPVKAIHVPAIEKYLFGAFDMEVFKKWAEQEPQQSIEACTKGLVWIGVRKYLREIKA